MLAFFILKIFVPEVCSDLLIFQNPIFDALLASSLLSENGAGVLLFFISNDPGVGAVKFFKISIQTKGTSQIITK